MSWLPEGALEHDPNAYMNKALSREKTEVKAGKLNMIGSAAHGYHFHMVMARKM
jgi:hypothetical protein